MLTRPYLDNKWPGRRSELRPKFEDPSDRVDNLISVIFDSQPSENLGSLEWFTDDYPDILVRLRIVDPSDTWSITEDQIRIASLRVAWGEGHRKLPWRMLLKRETSATWCRMVGPGATAWILTLRPNDVDSNSGDLIDRLLLVWEDVAEGRQRRFPMQDAYLTELVLCEDTEALTTEEAVDFLQAIWLGSFAKMGWRCFLERRT